MNTRNWVLRSALASAVLLLPLFFISPVIGQEGPKWGPESRAVGKLGTDRSLGELDLFVPVWQTDRTLVFGDLRGRLDDNSSEEGNFGAGIRHMLDNGWNVGGYAFYDLRSSPEDNTFKQVTAGLEALSVDWDVRVNGYVPVGDKEKSVPGEADVSLSGGQLRMEAGRELALWGVDAEVGYRLPVTLPDSDYQTRIYAGGYHFDDSELEDSVTGPRVRAEFRWHEPMDLWDGSSVTFTAEWQTDDPRDQQAFVGARVSVPIPFPEKIDHDRLTPRERRMTEFVQRDVDVVTQSGSFGSSEPVKTASGVKISDAVKTKNPGAGVNQAGQNGLVIVNGEDGPVDGGVSMQQGQTVLGGGTKIRVKGARSGQVATFKAPGQRPTIFGGGGAEDYVVEMASDTTLRGVDVGPGNTADDGIRAPGGVDGVSIADTRVRNMPDDGIDFDGTSTNVSIRNSVVQNTDEEGIEFDDDAMNVEIRNTLIESTDDNGLEFDEDATNVVFADSTIQNTDDEGFYVGEAANNVWIRNSTIQSTDDETVEFDGTSNTIRIVNSTIQNSENDEVVEFGGDTTDVVVTNSRFASAEEEIFRFDDGAENVRISNSSFRGGADGGIIFDSSSETVTNVRIRNNTIEGVGGDDEDDLIRFDSSDTSDVRIAGNSLNGADNHGILFDSDGASDIEITGNTIENVAEDAIELQDNADEVLIADNTINNVFDGSDGIHFGDGASNVEVLRNNITNTEEDAIDFVDDAENVVIAENTVRNVRDEGVEFSEDATNIEIKNNSIVNTDDSGVDLEENASNILIAENRIRNSENDEGIEIGDNASDVEILKNVVRNAEDEGFDLNGSVDGLLIENNRITNTRDDGIEIAGGDTVQNAQIFNNTIDTVGTGDAWMDINSVDPTDVEITGNTFRGVGGDTVVEIGDGTPNDGNYFGGDNTNETSITAPASILVEPGTTGGSGFSITTNGNTVTSGP